MAASTISEALGRDLSSRSVAWMAPGADQVPQIISTSVSLALVTLFMSIRVWSQHKRHRLLSLDNITLAAAFVLAYAALVVHMLSILTGYNDDSYVTEPNEVMMLKLYFKVLCQPSMKSICND